MDIVIPLNAKRRASSHKNWTTAGWLLLGLVLCFSPGSVCRAQDNPQTTVEDDAAPEVSRDAWQQRIQEARRRANEIAIDRRKHPELYLPPPPPDPEIEATERVMNDQSLQRGDIVSTRNGLFVFRGRGDQQRRDDDFVRIPSR